MKIKDLFNFINKYEINKYEAEQLENEYEEMLNALTGGFMLTKILYPKIEQLEKEKEELLDNLIEVYKYYDDPGWVEDVEYKNKNIKLIEKLTNKKWEKLCI